MTESDEFQKGVESERKRIMEALYRYKAEGLEIVPVNQEPGVTRSAVKRFDTNELIQRLWKEARSGS